MIGAASCIRHEEDKKKNRDFGYDYFSSILGINYQSGLKKILSFIPKRDWGHVRVFVRSFSERRSILSKQKSYGIKKRSIKY